jgi:hypothetical protein
MSRITPGWLAEERVLPQTFVDYESPAREYMLTAVNTVVDVHTRVSDLYSVASSYALRSKSSRSVRRAS